MTLFVLIVEISDDTCTYLLEIIAEQRKLTHLTSERHYSDSRDLRSLKRSLSDRYLSHELTHGAFCRACTIHLRRKADYLWCRILPREQPVAKRQTVIRFASFISLVIPVFSITDISYTHL